MNKCLLENKRILITGSSNGLGLAMAKALGMAGASVLLAARNAIHTEKALQSLLALNIHADSVTLDVRNEYSIQQTVQWIENHWGGLDMLINNAGIGMRTVNSKFLSDPLPFYKISTIGFRDLIDTNLTGYFLVTKAMVPFFLGQKKGKIVNITMNHETMRRKGFIPYGPSRAGTESLSLIMAEDLKEFSIDVNMLLPGGATETGMIPDEYRQNGKLPFALLNPDVMAEAIIYLASDESNGLTGERIVANQFQQWYKERFIQNK
jgi:gluconate 5-dehydrogenase